MISIVLTNRNRDLSIVKKCLDSLAQQSRNDFELFFMDYGSNREYLLNLEQLILKYPKIQFVSCPVSYQLWNKARAINIALKKCKTEFFFVADIDMIFHNDFVKRLYQLKNENVITYFQVGFLSQEETKQNKDFDNSNIEFVSGIEATGMTLYPTSLLKEINGYDEFYHGWGAEDTDTHIRLRNLGIEVVFFNKETLLKHQWHPKYYRTNQSKDPYHFNLEKINHSYIHFTDEIKVIKANINNEWGVMPVEDFYLKLSNAPDYTIEIDSEKIKLNALLSQFPNFTHKVIWIKIKDVSFKSKIVELTKKTLRKKYKTFWTMKAINDMILLEIIKDYKNNPYEYIFDQNQNTINLKIYFP
ncbi:glycosyltransferase family 2 protein [Flavobacterium ginsenosidimutans]|uniref:Glycosyltransferase n=1 Tax=Flavobacterium ginsenosidimutans TaxID=687844 RepID=A0ABZ2QDN4_9FLAO|nr:glycosyltransferase [Flavobacterium ginsenosidimutans]KAF2334180.1 glycosyltransferase [Flavobacterium ginsenosidimutans]